MIFKKKELSPNELYYQRLVKQNLPWRILKALAVVLLVGLIVIAMRERSRTDESGYQPSSTGSSISYLNP